MQHDNRGLQDTFALTQHSNHTIPYLLVPFMSSGIDRPSLSAATAVALAQKLASLSIPDNPAVSDDIHNNPFANEDHHLFLEGEEDDDQITLSKVTNTIYHIYCSALIPT